MFISEVLPNPKGKDTESEWIELFNDQSSAVALDGWKIKDKSGKTYLIKDKNISANGFLVLDYSQTKISLNNDGDEVYLYDSNGIIKDSFIYSGSYKDDVSASREGNIGNVFQSALSTKGANNVIKEIVSPKKSSATKKENLTASLQQTQVPTVLDKIISPKENILLLALVVGFLLAIIFSIFYKEIRECKSNL